MYLCRSTDYRTIKLLIVGNTAKGKTTLLRRMKGLHFDEKLEQTEGIDIDTWVYPDPKLFKMNRTGKKQQAPVTFMVWDFAGQVCRTT